MSKLIIDNNYSVLQTDNEFTKETLWKLLRFREKGYFHSRLYRQRKWDGFRDFFSIKTGKFLTGLLPEVKLVLNQLNEDYDTVDKRQSFNFIQQSINEEFLGKGINLYDYQVEIVNQIMKYKRGVVVAPTGAGKSMICTALCRCLPPKTPALILANRKSLIEQIYQDLVKFEVPYVGRLYDKAKEPNYITCSTVQSACKMEKVLQKIQVAIVDEIHEGMSNQFFAIYRKLTNAVVRIGMSATPFKEGDDTHMYRVKGWFGAPLKIQCSPSKKLDTKYLQERTTLSKSICYFYPIREPKIPYHIYQDALTEGIAESKYFNQTVTRLASTLKGRTLVLVDRIAQGEILHQMIPGSFWIKGDDDLEVRAPVIELLRKYEGTVTCIATSGILNTGISFNIHNLINCGSTKAQHIVIQRIGRGLRTASDKEKLNYFDWIFDINPYLKSHSEKRLKTLTKEGHEIVVKEEIDF